MYYKIIEHEYPEIYKEIKIISKLRYKRLIKEEKIFDNDLYYTNEDYKNSHRFTSINNNSSILSKSLTNSNLSNKSNKIKINNLEILNNNIKKDPNKNISNNYNANDNTSIINNNYYNKYIFNINSNNIIKNNSINHKKTAYENTNMTKSTNNCKSKNKMLSNSTIYNKKNHKIKYIANKSNTTKKTTSNVMSVTSNLDNNNNCKRKNSVIKLKKNIIPDIIFNENRRLSKMSETVKRIANDFMAYTSKNIVNTESKNIVKNNESLKNQYNSEKIKSLKTKNSDNNIIASKFNKSIIKLDKLASSNINTIKTLKFKSASIYSKNSKSNNRSSDKDSDYYCKSEEKAIKEKVLNNKKVFKAIKKLNQKNNIKKKQYETDISDIEINDNYYLKSKKSSFVNNNDNYNDKFVNILKDEIYDITKEQKNLLIEIKHMMQKYNKDYIN